METSLSISFREKFLTMREDLVKEIERVRLASEEVLLAGQDGAMDEVDCTIQGSEEIISYKLIGRATFLLKKLDESILKLNRGSFGVCEDCGQDIGIGRLMARPMARLCIHCKENEERTEQHIPYDKRSHTLGDGLKVLSASSENIAS